MTEGERPSPQQIFEQVQEFVNNPPPEVVREMIEALDDARREEARKPPCQCRHQQ